MGASGDDSRGADRGGSAPGDEAPHVLELDDALSSADTLVVRRSGVRPQVASSPDIASERLPIPLGIELDGKYFLRQLLGKGSMGVVYLAEDVALERPVALKVLLPQYAADERLARHFHREAVAMARVRHNNVVQIFSYGSHDGLPYFVMEYIEGQTVADQIERAAATGEPIYLDVALGILGQICHGLQAVHDLRIVHRDVKPGNMLIGPLFRVALADFGLVEQVDASSSAPQLAGTPMYLAPELLRSKTKGAVPDGQRHLADIYALGVSAFELLTGVAPFDGASVGEVLRCHLKQDPPRLSDIRADLPPALDDVMGRALAKDPAQRHQSCMELQRALVRARGEGPATVVERRAILVVDDDPEEHMSFSTALKIGMPHAEIDAVDRGQEAIVRARRQLPELVLLDMEIPDMNGVEICATLAADESTASIPVIAISDSVDSETRGVLQTLGVYAAMERPVDLVQLVNLVRQAIDAL